MSKKNKKLMCAVYLSVDAPDKEIQDKEEKQFRYIKDYCKGNGLKIVKSYHRAGLSRCEMQKHFVELARQIEVGSPVAGIHLKIKTGFLSHLEWHCLCSWLRR